MPVINFYPRFADDVAAGRITQAICMRKVNSGNLVELFSGQRALGVGRVDSVRQVVVSYNAYEPAVFIDGVQLDSLAMHRFARACGFPGVSELIDFYADYHTMPLSGYVIEWQRREEAVPA